MTKPDSGVIAANFGDLAAAANMMKKTAKDIEDQLEALNKDLAELATWEGESKNLFGQKSAEWNKCADELKEMCHRMGVAVEDGQVRMQEAERVNAARFS